MKVRYFTLFFLLIGQILLAAPQHDGGAPSDERRLPPAKPETPIEAVDKLDPNLQLAPIDLRDAVRSVLAVTTKNIHEIENDPQLKPEEKEARVKMIQDFQRSMLRMMQQVSRITPMALAFNVCTGMEVNFGFLWPKKWSRVASPGLRGTACVTFAAALNARTGLIDRFVVAGPTFLAGGQLEHTEKGPNGTDIASGVEVNPFQVSVMFPVNLKVPHTGINLTTKSPKTRLGDLQGFYAGLNTEILFGARKMALGANNEIESSSNVWNLAGHIRLPEADIAMVTVGKVNSAQRRQFNFKGEGMFYITPWAYDGTSARIPFVSWNGQHSPKGRFEHSIDPAIAKELNDPEIQKILKSGEAEKAVKEALDSLQAQRGNP